MLGLLFGSVLVRGLMCNTFVRIGLFLAGGAVVEFDVVIKVGLYSFVVNYVIYDDT
jgi:hypothetical protein